MPTIIVSGALANKPGNAGGAWERLSWAGGLRRLRLDVYFVEQIGRRSCVDDRGAATDFADSVNARWFRSATEWFGFRDRSALVCCDGEQCAGLAWDELIELAASCDLLVNLSGHLTLPPLAARIRRKAYIDVDPGFTQFWHADPRTSFKLEGHDFYFTIGENIGRPDCPIPTSGLQWRPIRQPVVLDDWPVTRAGEGGRFTTVASWRGPYGAVEYDGRVLGLKCHEFRKFIELPGRVERNFELALAIDPADDSDLRALEEHGWKVVEPRAIAGDAAAFRRYIQQSAAEFSVAQGVYVETNSGWFSDRTVRYLASGKPALVQETGFSEHLPCGEGLIAFRTVDDAVRGALRIMSDYDGHCQAARAIAENYFDSDKVLGKFLQDVGM
ncbi:MAG TPA: hypothetical protein VJ783_28360 [Pirellulales bacterium]|nr:hypothetical protein [Pirellulales bacterium]